MISLLSTFFLLTQILSAQCSINNISFSVVSACNPNSTSSVNTDDYFTANITVTFVNPPTLGTLNLTGDVLAGGGALSIPVTGLTTNYTFTGVRLRADNTVSIVTATFSNDLACTFTINSGPTVTSCSGCNDNPTPVETIDLTSAPNASAIGSLFTFGEECCTSNADNEACVLVNILLHPGASGVDISASGAASLFAYSPVNCGALPTPVELSPSTPIAFCNIVPPGGQVLICRPGGGGEVTVNATSIPTLDIREFACPSNDNPQLNIIGVPPTATVDWSCTPMPQRIWLSSLTSPTPSFTYGGAPVTDCNGIQVPVCVTVPASTGCATSAQVLNENVTLYPSLTSGRVVTCANGNGTVTLTYLDNNSCSNLNYSWGTGANTVSIIVPANSGNYNVSVSYVGQTTSICPTAVFTGNSSAPVLLDPADQALCSGSISTIPVNLVTPFANTGFIWFADGDLGTPTTNTASTTFGNTAIISGTLTNATTSCVTVTYTVRPYTFGANGINNNGSGDDCLGVPITVDVLVSSVPNAPTVSPIVYCQDNVPASLAASITANNTAVRYYTTATGGMSIATPVPPVIPGCYTYYVSQTITNACTPASGCESLRTRMDIVVFPRPVIATAGNACNGQLTINAPTTVAGFNIEYSFNNGATYSSSTTSSGLNPGCHVIRTRYRLAADCGNISTTTANALIGTTCDSPSGNAVIFPAVPSVMGANEQCNTAISITPLPTIAGFTAQYTFNLNGAADVWGTSTTSPTTPGCYTIRQRYILTAVCGGTPAGATGTLGSCVSSETTAVIFPAVPAVAGASNQCNTAISVTPLPVVTGFTAQYTFNLNGATDAWGTSTTSPTTPGCYIIRQRYILTAACGFTNDAGDFSTDSGCAATETSAVIFPPVPALSAPSAGCNSSIVLTQLTAYSGFTAEYTFNLNGAADNWTTTFSSPIAPGCYTIKHRYVLTSACGLTAVGTFSTAPACDPEQAQGFIFPTAPATPVVSNTCAAPLTIPALPSVVGLTAQYSFDDGITWSTSNTSPTSAPACYTMRTRYIAAITCGSTTGGDPGESSCIVSGQGFAVIFPTAPAAPTVANTCAAALTIPVLPDLTDFTEQYSFDGGTTWGTSNVSTSTTPGCYSMRTRYILTSACGGTAANMAGTGACGASAISNAVIFPTAPAAPTVANTCAAALTIPVLPDLTDFTEQYSFDGGTTWGTSNVSTSTTPGCYSMRTRYILTAACGGTVANTAGTGACSVSTIGNAVIYPLAPMAPIVSNTCATTLIIPTIATVSQFTSQYSFDDGLTWGTSNTLSSTTPGCYTMRTRYILTAACGETLAGSVGNNSCVQSPSTSAIIFPQPAIASAQQACNGDVTVTATTAVPNSNFQWLYNIDGGTYQTSNVFLSQTIGTHNVTIIAEYIGGGNCSNGTRLCPTPVFVSTSAILPNITLDAILEVCNSVTSFTVPYISTVGAVTNYTITPAGANPLPGFVNVVNAPIIASPITLILPTPPLTAGVYTFTISVANSTCVSANIPFTLTINANPTANPVTLAMCDDGDGSVLFNLPDAEDPTTQANIDGNATDVDNGATNVIVTYHLTQTNAINDVMPITSLFLTGNGIIFARVENSVTGCFTVTPITLVVNPLPTLSIAAIPITCQPLTVDATTLNLGQSPVGGTITYYTTLLDAQNEINSLDPATLTAVAMNVLIYVRYELPTGCYTTGVLDIQFGLPPAMPRGVSDITVCPGGNTTIAPDLTAMYQETTFNWDFEAGITGLGLSSNTSVGSHAPVQTVGSGLTPTTQTAGLGCTNSLLLSSYTDGATTVAQAIANADYVEFCVGANASPLYIFGGVDAITWTHRSSFTGPDNWALFASNNLATPILSSAITRGDNCTTVGGAFDLNTATCYRLYYWGANSPTGTIRLSDISIHSIYNFVNDGTCPIVFTYYDANPEINPAATLLATGNSYNPGTTLATSPQTVWVVATDCNGCVSETVPVVITILGDDLYQAPQPDPVGLCNKPGSHVDLIAPDGYTYTWSTGATTQSINVDAPGSYNVTILNPTTNCDQVLTYVVGLVPDQGLVCNDFVHISLDNLCEVVVTPQMYLEGEYPFYTQFEILITHADGTINNILTAADIGDTLMISVRDTCNGNSCWGFLIAEDKIAPILSCCGEGTNPICHRILCPARNAVIAAAQNHNIAALASYGIAPPASTENCGLTWQVAYVDATPPSEMCSGNIRIRWTATDIGGNVASCIETIQILNPSLEDVTPPPVTVVVECGTNDDISPSITGYPMLDDMPLNSSICNLSAGFVDIDTLYDICGVNSNARKVVRQWSLLDWCTQQIQRYTQIIKINDSTPPTINNVTAVKQPNYLRCGENVRLSVGTVSDGCSRNGVVNNAIRYRIERVGAINSCVPTADNISLPIVGTVLPTQITDAIFLPVGNYTITLTVVDYCGNITTTSIPLSVVDAVDPTPVSPEFVQTTLNPWDCQADVYATSFNQGSWDNCGIDSMWVRRMEVNGDGVYGNGISRLFPTGTNGNLETWYQYIHVDSRDLSGTPISNIGNACGQRQVRFLVEDCTGRIAQNMISLFIDDKTAPSITPPDDQTLSCENAGIDIPWILQALSGATSYAYTLPAADPHALDALFGSAIITDQCGLEGVTISTSIINNGCDEYTLTRQWVAADKCGNSTARSTTINIENTTNFAIEYDRFFIVSCTNGDVSLDATTQGGDIPAPRLDEIYFIDSNHNYQVDANETFHTGCAVNLAMGYEDQILPVQGGDDACYKILRKWTIINWCSYDVDNTLNDPLGVVENLNYQSGLDAFNYSVTINGGFELDSDHQDYRHLIDDARTGTGEDGYFQIEQIIKVYDHTVPNVTLATIDRIEITDGCTATSNPTYTVDDECNSSTTNSLLYRVQPFDVIPNGVCQTSWSPWLSFAPNSTVLRCGLVEFQVKVTDACGNTGAAITATHVIDTKKPTLVVYNGLATTLMPATGMVEIWASDFVQYAYDNCNSADAPNPYYDPHVTASARIRRAGTNDAWTTSLAVNCHDIGTLQIDVAVWDDANCNNIYGDSYTEDCSGLLLEDNFDFVTTYMLVQNNMGADCLSFENASIAGDVHTEEHEGVEEVVVSIIGTTAGLPAPSMTDAAGNYSFAGIPALFDYTVSPYKNSNPLNGVTTYDLVLIQKHILGLISLNSPYKIIAADANHSNTVTTYDVVQLRQLILHAIETLPSNDSWRFVDAGFGFAYPSGDMTWEFPERYNITQLSNDMTIDFVGVKIGDVNNTVVANTLLGTQDRSATGTLYIHVEDKSLQKNETVTVPFTA
ncbi:MAG: hypothetical protein WAS72_09665, partial [Saprospiraceae bacterium]